MPSRLQNAFLTLASLIFGYLVVEAGYRVYQYYSLAILTGFQVTTMDVREIPSVLDEPGNVRGVYAPNNVLTLVQYDKDDQVGIRNRVHINNFGWVSRFDYPREKPAGEYRIAVVGDSLTASINNNFPWPDELQRKLNEDRELLAQLNVERIAVLNLGVPGASLDLMANPLAKIARRFSADMVVVNFITEDLARHFGRSLDVVPGRSDDVIDATTTQPALFVPHIEVEGVEAPLYCPAGTELRASNPECRVSPFWYVPPGRDLGRADLKRIKQAVARQLLLHRVLLSPRPLVIRELFRGAGITSARAQIISQTTSHPRDDENIAVGLKALSYISHLADWKVLVTHSPLYWHLARTARSAALDPFVAQARAQGFDVVLMEEHMPMQRGEREWFRWYNLPFDGHWSDYGAEVYAAAMYRMLRTRLLSGAVVSVAACGDAYAHFTAARETHARNQFEEAQRRYSQAIAALPANALDFAHLPSAAYSDCGFVTDLYVEAALLQQRRGKPPDWDEVAARTGDPLAVHRARLELYKARGEIELAKTALDALIKLQPDELEYRVARGDIALARRDGILAAADFERALQGRPVDVGLLFRSSQAQMMIGNHSVAIARATAALAISPDNASLLFLRAAARSDSDDQRGALADIDAALALVPDNITFRAQRTAIIDRMKGPDDSPEWIERGDAAVVSRDYVEAAASYTRALKRRPNDVSVLYRAIEAKWRSADYAGAIADADRALTLAPNHAEILYLRAYAKTDSGAQHGALIDIDAALAIKVGEPTYQALRDMIVFRRRTSPWWAKFLGR